MLLGKGRTDLRRGVAVGDLERQELVEEAAVVVLAEEGRAALQQLNRPRQRVDDGLLLADDERHLQVRIHLKHETFRERKKK